MQHTMLLRLAAVTSAIAVVGCFGDTTAPRHPGQARLAVAPVFKTSFAASVVAFTKVRITLTRSSGTALDTTVIFPAGDSTLSLSLEVPLLSSTENLSLNLAMINAAGDTVFRGGPETVTVSVGVNGTGTGVPVPIRYVGIGANARSVKIATKTVSTFFRDTVQLTAQALDSAGNPIVGTPIAWTSLDTALAHVPVDTLGRVIAGITRGVARVQALLPTGPADTAQVTVQPVPVAIGVFSGGAQTATVGTALASPVVMRVKAADSLGVQGVVVNFTVASGGGSLSKLVDTTNASGDAPTAWTLGTLAGAQSISAALAAQPSLTSTAAATAVAGAATKLAFQVQPSSSVAGASLSPSVQVVAQDVYGNTATTFTGTVTLAMSGGTAGASLRGTKSVAAAAGVATFPGLSVDSVGTGYTLSASATGLTGASSGAFTVATAPPARLVFTTQPASTTAGVGFGVVATARDSIGNTATGFAGSVSVAISAGTGTAGADRLRPSGVNLVAKGTEAMNSPSS
jgi:hypothetical protein